MIGTKISAAINITKRVNSLLEASQTVSEALGLRLDGKMNGKRVRPTVEIIPKIATEWLIKALPKAFDLTKKKVKISPKKPRIGAANIQR